MQKRLIHWERACCLAVCALGTLGHYLYAWTGRAPIAAAFASVNESTWEHMKLFYWPYLLCTAAECTVFGDAFRNYFAVKAAALLLGMVAIPTLHYTVSGAFGQLPGWGNAAIFYVSAALAYVFSAWALRRGALKNAWMQPVGFGALLAPGLLFAYWTFRPPALPLFRDPVGGGYGA